VKFRQWTGAKENAAAAIPAAPARAAGIKAKKVIDTPAASVLDNIPFME
jgi:hypothetical protein